MISGRLDRATRLINKVIFMSHRSEMRLYEASSLLLLTDLHLRQSNLKDAAAAFQRAKAIITSTGYARRYSDCVRLESALKPLGGGR
jgi:hypothetical protein